MTPDARRLAPSGGLVGIGLVVAVGWWRSRSATTWNTAGRHALGLSHGL